VEIANNLTLNAGLRFDQMVHGRLSPTEDASSDAQLRIGE
jgi:hypothetical protein